MSDENDISDFDMRAFRGHFRIAASHFEAGVANFEKLQKHSSRQAKEIKQLQTELAESQAECGRLREENNLLIDIKNVAMREVYRYRHELFQAGFEPTKFRHRIVKIAFAATKYWEWKNKQEKNTNADLQTEK